METHRIMYHLPYKGQLIRSVHTTKPAHSAHQSNRLKRCKWIEVILNPESHQMKAAAIKLFTTFDEIWSQPLMTYDPKCMLQRSLVQKKNAWISNNAILVDFSMHLPPITDRLTKCAEMIWKGISTKYGGAERHHFCIIGKETMDFQMHSFRKGRELKKRRRRSYCKICSFKMSGRIPSKQCWTELLLSCAHYLEPEQSALDVGYLLPCFAVVAASFVSHRDGSL